MVKKLKSDNKARPKQEEDYYYENGLLVFTRNYHLKRGFCCKQNCRHCPYRNDTDRKGNQ